MEIFPEIIALDIDQYDYWHQKYVISIILWISVLRTLHSSTKEQRKNQTTYENSVNSKKVSKGWPFMNTQ